MSTALDDQFNNELRQRYEAGASIRELVKYCGTIDNPMSFSSIRRLLQRLAVQLRSSGVARDVPRPPIPNGNPALEAITRRLAELRRERGATLEAVYQKAFGTGDKSVLSQWEHGGNRPRYASLAQLAAGFDLVVPLLLDDASTGMPAAGVLFDITEVVTLLAQRRGQCGLTVTDVGRIAFRHDRFGGRINQWERGKLMPTYDNTCRYADAVGWTLTIQLMTASELQNEVARRVGQPPFAPSHETG